MCGVEVAAERKAGDLLGEVITRCQSPTMDIEGFWSHKESVPSLAAPGTLSSLRQFRQIFDEGQGLLENLDPLPVQPDPLSPAFFGLAEPVALASLHTLLEVMNPNVDPAGDVVSAAAGILSL